MATGAYISVDTLERGQTSSTLPVVTQYPPTLDILNPQSKLNSSRKRTDSPRQRQRSKRISRLSTREDDIDEELEDFWSSTWFEIMPPAQIKGLIGQEVMMGSSMGLRSVKWDRQLIVTRSRIISGSLLREVAIGTGMTVLRIIPFGSDEELRKEFEQQIDRTEYLCGLDAIRITHNHFDLMLGIDRQNFDERFFKDGMNYIDDDKRPFLSLVGERKLKGRLSVNTVWLVESLVFPYGGQPLRFGNGVRLFNVSLGGYLSAQVREQVNSKGQLESVWTPSIFGDATHDSVVFELVSLSSRQDDEASLTANTVPEYFGGSGVCIRKNDAFRIRHRQTGRYLSLQFVSHLREYLGPDEDLQIGEKILKLFPNPPIEGIDARYRFRLQDVCSTTDVFESELAPLEDVASLMQIRRCKSIIYNGCRRVYLFMKSGNVPSIDGADGRMDKEGSEVAINQQHIHVPEELLSSSIAMLANLQAAIHVASDRPITIDQSQTGGKLQSKMNFVSVSTSSVSVVYD